MSQQFLFKTAVCITLHTGTVETKTSLGSGGGVTFWINTSKKAREWFFLFLGSFHSDSNTWLMRVSSGLHRHFPAQERLLSAGPLHLACLLLSNFPGLSILASSLALPGSFLLQALFRQVDFSTCPGFSDPSLLGPCLSASLVTLHRHSFPVSTPGCGGISPRKGILIHPNATGIGKWALKIISAY